MGIMKSRQISSGRYPVRQGIDFSIVESLVSNFTGTPGTTIKFRGGTTIGYDHATRGGVRLKSTRDDEYAHGFAIEDAITCSKESRKGAFYMYSARASGEAVTTGWGGGEDQLMNLTLRNYANNTGGLGLKGLDLNVRNRSGGVATNLYGALVTAEQSGTLSGNMYGMRVVTKNSGVHSGGTHHALEVSDESQGTFTGATLSTLVYIEKHSNSYGDLHEAAVYIVNKSATSAKVITSAIYLKCGATGANITNVLQFDSTDGTDGFTAVANKTHQGNVDGYFQVKQGSNTYYVLCWDTVPS